MDIAKGHVAALKQIVDPTFHGVKIYNLGTGKGVTVLEIVKTFERVTGKQIPYEIVDRRPGDVASCFASSTLAEKELDSRQSWTWRTCVGTCGHGSLKTLTVSSRDNGFEESPICI